MTHLSCPLLVVAFIVIISIGGLSVCVNVCICVCVFETTYNGTNSSKNPQNPVRQTLFTASLYLFVYVWIGISFQNGIIRIINKNFYL